MVSDLFGNAIDPGCGRTAFEIGDTEPLRIATFRVLVAWHERDWQPGAEKWQSDTRKWRPVLIDAIRHEWERIVGKDQAVFPWHDDFVMLGFVAIRKMSVTQKRDMCKYLEMQIPAVWSSDKERAE